MDSENEYTKWDEGNICLDWDLIVKNTLKIDTLWRYENEVKLIMILTRTKTQNLKKKSEEDWVKNIAVKLRNFNNISGKTEKLTYFCELLDYLYLTRYNLIKHPVLVKIVKSKIIQFERSEVDTGLLTFYKNKLFPEKEFCLSLIECIICCECKIQTTLDCCNQTICESCFNQTSECPFCRSSYLALWP